MTHTKGPWKHDETWGLIVSETGREIAACHAGRTGKADARLIASAPELLEAVKSLIPLAAHVSPQDVNISIARKLIARIEGVKS